MALAPRVRSLVQHDDARTRHRPNHRMLQPMVLGRSPDAYLIERVIDDSPPTIVGGVIAAAVGEKRQNFHPTTRTVICVRGHRDFIQPMQPEL